MGIFKGDVSGALRGLMGKQARRSWSKVGWRLLRTVLFIYGSVELYLYFFADRMIFLPPAPSYEHTPQDDSTAITLTSADGNELAARYLHNPDSRYTILFSHGNATDMGGVMPILLSLKAQGFSVMTYDYPGYGHSTGNPTEQNSYLAIEAAYDYLTTELELLPENIIVQGQSVGGGPSTHLAASKPVAGLVLESSFATAFQVVVPFRIMPFEKFPNIRHIDDIDCPLLLLHGTHDTIIPYSHSEELLAAANSPKQLVPIEGADHNDILWVGEETYLQSIQTFANNLSEIVANRSHL
mgnify:CR=1 FL=1